MCLGNTAHLQNRPHRSCSWQQSRKSVPRVVSVAAPPEQHQQECLRRLWERKCCGGTVQFARSSIQEAVIVITAPDATNFACNLPCQPSITGQFVCPNGMAKISLAGFACFFDISCSAARHARDVQMYKSRINEDRMARHFVRDAMQHKTGSRTRVL